MLTTFLYIYHWPSRSRGDEGANFLKNRQQMKMSELDEQLAEYIAEWRKQRQKEEDELNKLKDKQAKRKVRSNISENG